MIKFLCDKADCGVEIIQREGGGTFTFMIKETMLDPKKQVMSRLRQEEFQLCTKHAQEIVDFIKEKSKKQEETP